MQKLYTAHACMLHYILALLSFFDVNLVYSRIIVDINPLNLVKMK
jgi:hypothetical protein